MHTPRIPINRLTKLLFLLFFIFTHPSHLSALEISSQEANAIGHLIWKNECRGSLSGLTTWNKGEEFASMGIGHFIWFPKNCKAPFEEQFPKLLAYFEQNGIILPTWIPKNKICPWSNRESFQEDLDKEKLKELRALLASTINLQAEFMVNRLEKALGKILENVDLAQRERIKKEFYRLASVKQGKYVLLDYLNFKGMGTSPKEKYQGEGWGLLQVLEKMALLPQKEPLEEFVTSAKKLLRKRVDNAPPNKKEERWLKGWYNRLNTYLTNN